MRVDRTRFQSIFIQRAGRLPRENAPAASGVQDKVEIGASDQSPTPNFKKSVLALSTAASLGGIPAIAALAQEVSKSLVTAEQEDESSARLAAQLSSLPREIDTRVSEAWKEVESARPSPFVPPVVLDSVFIDAQSDSRAIYVGTGSLRGDLSDDSILAFTLAHEEGHRIHRDSAGAAGLETLLELCQEDEELYPVAFKALNLGRLENERQADRYAAETLQTLNVDRTKITEFLRQLPGDPQHPDGVERAALVSDVWSKHPL